MGCRGGLTQYHPVLGGPGTHQVQGPSAIAPVMATSQGLAINGHHFSLDQLAHRSHPLAETGSKLFRVQHAEYPTKGVVRGNPVGQLQKPVKPFPLGLAKLLDLHPVVCSTEDGAQGYHDDVQQLVQLGTSPSGIRLGSANSPKCSVIGFNPSPNSTSQHLPPLLLFPYLTISLAPNSKCDCPGWTRPEVESNWGQCYTRAVLFKGSGVNPLSC